MDLLGTCDAFCEITWQGQRGKTAVKKNSYSPDWDETFAFYFDDVSQGMADLQGSRPVHYPKITTTTTGISCVRV